MSVAFEAPGFSDFFGVEAHALEQLEPFERAEGKPASLGLNRSRVLGFAVVGGVRAWH